MMPPVALAGLPFLTRDPEPEPEPESELSVGMLCRVLPAAAVEAVLAMLSGTTERHGSSSLSEEQRLCCGKVGVAVNLDDHKRIVKLQFTGDLGSRSFPYDVVTTSTSTDADAVTAGVLERHRAQRERQVEDARRIAEERRQQLVDLKDLTVELLDTATARAFARLTELRRLDKAATCISAHYRGFVARRMKHVLVADQRIEEQRAARVAEAESAADDMSNLMAVLDKMSQQGNDKAGWSVDSSSNNRLRAAAAGIDGRVRPGGGVAQVPLGPLWVPGTTPHNRLVTALLDEAVRSGGGRVLFRAPRSGMLDLSGGGAAAWCGLCMPRGPRQMLMTSLDLSGAKLEDSGAAGLASGLFGSSPREGVCALREIRLADCGLGPRGVVSIAACLEACPAVRLLDLRGNSAGLDGGHALAAAVSHPRSLLTVLVFNLNTVVTAATMKSNFTVPAAPLVPWSRDDYQSVVQAFTEALPASALTHLDIGYASTGSDGTLSCLRTAALPVAWVATTDTQGSNRRGLKLALPSGSTGASNGPLWLGLSADSFHQSIARPLALHAKYAMYAARQRLAWAISVARGAKLTTLPQAVVVRIAAQMGRPMMPHSDLDAGPLPDSVVVEGTTMPKEDHHYRCCLAAAIRQGPEMDSPLLGRSLQVGEVVAALEVVALPGSAARLRFRIPSPPLLGMTAWVSLRAADGRDVLRPLEAVITGTGSFASMSDAVAMRSTIAPNQYHVPSPIEGDRREAVDAKRRAALSSAAARHLASILLRQRSKQSHPTRAEFLIAFVADRLESASPRRRRRPKSAGGLDSAHLVDGVTRQLKRSTRWLILTSSDEIRNGVACTDGLRVRVRIQDAKKVHRRGDQVTLRVCKDRVAPSLGDNDSDDEGASRSENSDADYNGGSVYWEAIIECEPGTEWLSQVSAVASRLLQWDCPLANKIGTGWACLRSLFLHKEQQEQAEKLLRKTIAESQNALAKLGVGGQAQKYRLSLEERRQASIRNALLRRRRPTAAAASEVQHCSAGSQKKSAKIAIPHPKARAEDLLQYAMEMIDATEHTTAGGLWQVAHKRGADVLVEPALDAHHICTLPQGAMVEVLHKQPVLVELPPERVICQPPLKSELTVRRHASLLRTTRGWVVERLPDNDAVVLALLPWESLGKGHGGDDVLRTLRRKEVERITAVVDKRRSAATTIERWWRRCIVQSRVAIRRVAVAEVQALQGLLSVNLSRPVALAPTIALHLEDQAHVLERGLVEEISHDTKKAVRFVRPGSAAAIATASSQSSRQSAGLLRRADQQPPLRSSFARELHAHVSAAAAVWGGGEPSAAGDALGWLQGGTVHHHKPGVSDDPALGLAMTTEIASFTRTPTSPAMAAALRSDLATRRHPLRTMKAKLRRLEAGAVTTTRAADSQAVKERPSLSIFRSPRENLSQESEVVKRQRRKKAQEAREAELRRLTGEMDLALEKDVVKRRTRLSRAH